MGRLQPLVEQEQRKRDRTALTRLSLEDLQAVCDWLDDLNEEQFRVSDEFKKEVRRARQEIAADVHSRVRKPEGNS